MLIRRKLTRKPVVYKRVLKFKYKGRHLPTACPHDWPAHELSPRNKGMQNDIPDLYGLAVDPLHPHSAAHKNVALDCKVNSNLKDTEATTIVSLVWWAETLSLNESASPTTKQESENESIESICKITGCQTSKMRLKSLTCHCQRVTSARRLWSCSIETHWQIGTLERIFSTLQ